MRAVDKMLPRFNYVMAGVVMFAAGVNLWYLSMGRAMDKTADGIFLIVAVVLAFTIAGANVTNTYLIRANRELRRQLHEYERDLR